MPVKRPAPGDLEPIETASRDEIAALQLTRLRATLACVLHAEPAPQAAQSPQHADHVAESDIQDHRSVLPRQDNGPGSCELDGGRSAGQGGGEQGKGFAYGRAPDRRTVAGQRQPPGRM